MRETLEKLAQGKISVDEAEKALKMNIIENVANVAKLDIGRESRRSVPEMIFAEGKSHDDLLAICKRMLEKNGRVIITRLNEQQMDELQNQLKAHHVQIFPHARAMVVRRKDYRGPQTGGRVGVLTAGTVDLGVAEEAVMILQEMGCQTFLEADTGVAGIHRLIEPLKIMIENDVDCLVVVAGREGALPTVVAGLVDVPLIAVPASSGYGYGGRGEGALMAMLQACSLGLAVVNIDSGVAAGVVAAQIANRVARARTVH
ncbi:MAG: nickel pincer cofactor biosynthesis protein LarB [Candidatus Bathyarchaeia archaeon]